MRYRILGASGIKISLPPVELELWWIWNPDPSFIVSDKLMVFGSKNVFWIQFQNYIVLNIISTIHWIVYWVVFWIFQVSKQARERIGDRNRYTSRWQWLLSLRWYHLILMACPIENINHPKILIKQEPKTHRIKISKNYRIWESLNTFWKIAKECHR